MAEDRQALFDLVALLAILRAQYWMYQTSHWQAKGSNFYGTHLLFERLYKSVEEQTDVLAEKIVALFGPEYVDQLPSIEKSKYWISKWSEVSDLHKRGLQSEEDFMTKARSAYGGLKETKQLTLGLDDFLMAACNDHETNVYLLKQVIRG
jgi:DNA-binding ferritin-like protein